MARMAAFLQDSPSMTREHSWYSVKLQYVDDDPDSYANIFDNAKTDITKADKKRLIAALEKLGGEDAAGAVDAALSRHWPRNAW